MKLVVIICQNAFISGSPPTKRKNINEPLFYYDCQGPNEEIKDYYNGYKYQSSEEIDVPTINESCIKNFKANLTNELNIATRNQNKYLTKSDINLIAGKVTKKFLPPPVYTISTGLTFAEKISNNATTPKGDHQEGVQKSQRVHRSHY